MSSLIECEPSGKKNESESDCVNNASFSLPQNQNANENENNVQSGQVSCSSTQNVNQNENADSDKASCSSTQNSNESFDLPGLARNQYNIFQHVFVQGDRRDSQLVYTNIEKKLYSRNTKCKYGVSLRCHDRKCKCRRILCDNGVAIGLVSAPPHTCVLDYEQKFKDLLAKQDLKTRCAQIETIAGNAKMATVRSIFKSVKET